MPVGGCKQRLDRQSMPCAQVAPFCASACPLDGGHEFVPAWHTLTPAVAVGAHALPLGQSQSPAQRYWQLCSVPIVAHVPVAQS